MRTAAGKLLAVLGTFSRAKPELTLSELSRATGMPMSTLHRIVGELLSWRALERTSAGGYRIGLRIWELGSLSVRGPGLREVALPFMEDLYEVTHENVQLAVRDGVEVLFLERIAGRSAVPVLTRVGGRFAIQATGVGLVLLAGAPVDVLDQVLAAPMARFTPCTIVEPAELRRLLADVRRQGFAISDRQVTMNAVSVAAPVTYAGQTVAAMSIVVRGDGPAAVHPYIAIVRAATLAISRSLAGSSVWTTMSDGDASSGVTG